MDAKQIITELSQPFDKSRISQRKIGGRQVDYVEGHEYITRLNAASPAWSFRMTKSDVQMITTKRGGEQVQLPCLVVYGELEIPGVGTRAGIGVQMIEDNAGEDVMKGALTDCLKNCAKYFGLGLHMYGADVPPPPPVDYSDREDWKKANSRLHAVASNVIDKNSEVAHQAIKLMVQRTKGKESHKQLDAEALTKMAAFIESDAFDAYYKREIVPHMPQHAQGAF